MASTFYFDDSEMQEALEILIEKGISPEDYTRAWEMYERARRFEEEVLRNE